MWFQLGVVGDAHPLGGNGSMDHQLTRARRANTRPQFDAADDVTEKRAAIAYIAQAHGFVGAFQQLAKERGATYRSIVMIEWPIAGPYRLRRAAPLPRRRALGCDGKHARSEPAPLVWRRPRST